MKNYFKSFMGLAVAVLMSMVSVSCEKDSSGKKGVIDRDNIVGEWQLESIQYRYYENEQLVESDAENCDDSWYLIYKEYYVNLTKMYVNAWKDIVNAFIGSCKRFH